jgi:HSP20 family protein
VTREAVAIAGEHRYEKKAEDKGLFRTEFRYGKFQRVIPLPVAVQNDQVQAEFKDGILTLTLPKVTEARRQVVKVNLVDSAATPENTGASAESTANQTETTQTA